MPKPDFKPAAFTDKPYVAIPLTPVESNQIALSSLTYRLTV